MKKKLMILSMATILATTSFSNTLVKVGNKEITQKDVDIQLSTLPKEYQAQYQTEEGKKQILEALTVQEILKQEALKQGIDKTKEFKQKMEIVKDGLLGSELTDKKLNAVKVTQKEINDFYTKNPNFFKTPESVKASHILIKNDKQKAMDILKKVNVDNFAEMAKKYSEGPTKSRGGELGWFNKGQMVKAFEDAAFNGEKGVYPNLVKSEFGYHIILVQDKKEASVKKLSEIKELLEKQLLAQKQRETYTKWLNELKLKYNVK